MVHVELRGRCLGCVCVCVCVCETIRVTTRVQGPTCVCSVKGGIGPHFLSWVGQRLPSGGGSVLTLEGTTTHTDGCTSLKHTTGYRRRRVCVFKCIAIIISISPPSSSSSGHECCTSSLRLTWRSKVKVEQLSDFSSACVWGGREGVWESSLEHEGHCRSSGDGGGGGLGARGKLFPLTGGDGNLLTLFPMTCECSSAPQHNMETWPTRKSN